MNETFNGAMRRGGFYQITTRSPAVPERRLQCIYLEDQLSEGRLFWVVSSEGGIREWIAVDTVQSAVAARDVDAIAQC
jgi:hypothetical protein